ncbi:hypothetical protein Ndes2526B_g00565 [Nannochloris sp. 'desiccata']
MITGHLKQKPKVSLLLLGPKNSGKSELIKILKEQEGPGMLHMDLAIIDAYNTILNNLPPGQTKPVIVIDEANALQLWESKDSVALKQFLEFLKRSCKQYHTAHVILASSEFFMISWLQKQGYDANSRDDQVLGDLTSAEAFVYLCGGKVLNSSAIAGRKAWLKRCQSLKWRSLKV